MSSPPRERRLEGLCLRASPLGENDRLLVLLTEEQGLLKLAASGARRPRSSLAAAGALTLIKAQVARGRSLDRLRQMSVLHSYGRLGQRLELLAPAQWLLELAQLLIAENEPLQGALPLLLHRLGQLEALLNEPVALQRLEGLALMVQTSVQLLELAGVGLPLSVDLANGGPLVPPIGDWNWRCSLLPAEGFCSGRQAGAMLLLNASELALLQRLLRPQLPRRASGELMGPERVWRHLLDLLGLWCREHLGRTPKAMALLRQDWPASAERQSG
ncbi:MAG: recombination protein O N-terminal domain-containing protein [Synechococcus sp.]|nr:recombination protein O N-terminal domain-containing protein [Synechococcus sp.]